MVTKDTFYFCQLEAKTAGLVQQHETKLGGASHQSHPHDEECKMALVRPGANQTYGDGIGQKSTNSQ